MATKKLAFGGMSSMRNRMQQKPQAPAARTQAAADLAAKAAMAQKAGMSKNAPTMAALLASKQAGQPQMAAANPLQKMGSGPSRQAMMKKGGKVHSDVAMDKKVVKKAVKMHDDQLHGGKKTNLTKLAKGGVAKKFARGGGIEVRGKTKGTMVKMMKGGSCK